MLIFVLFVPMVWGRSTINNTALYIYTWLDTGFWLGIKMSVLEGGAIHILDVGQSY